MSHVKIRRPGEFAARRVHVSRACVLLSILFYGKTEITTKHKFKEKMKHDSNVTVCGHAECDSRETKLNFGLSASLSSQSPLRM